MKRVLATLVVLLSASAHAAAQTNSAPSTPTSTDEQALRKLDEQTLEAIIKNDRSFFEGLWTDDVLITDKNGKVTTKADVIKNIQPTPPDVKYMFTREDVKIHIYGDTAVVSGRTVGPIQVGTQTIPLDERSTDTYVRRGGKWVVVATHTSEIPAARQAAKIDPKVYDSYVGQYQLTPSVVYFMTYEGGKLMGQATFQGKPSGEKKELIPVSETTFVTKGGTGETIFVRDDKGKVIHIIFRDNGQENTLIKIK